MAQKLNDRQAQAVNYISGPSLVLAGAGSGKTSVITRKIAYLIEECGFKARNICALTFTNKAAREMKERVGKLVQGRASHGLTVSTFHNLGLNIIRREHKTLGYKPGFSIFDAADAKTLITELMLREVDCDEEAADSIQNIISNWKNDLVTPEQSLELARQPLDQIAAQVYVHYQRTLKAYNAVDFDDLILVPVQLFQSNPEVLDKWQNKLQYLLVDEYQDTNDSQYLLVKQLVGLRGQLTVVGDDDQSIYAWRGARPENLAKLQDDFPSLRVIKLEQNYRSTSRILRAANVLIANNPHVFEKTLWSEMGEGEKLRVIRCRNEDAEAERVALEILTHRLKHQNGYRDYAILYRGNYQSRLIEMKLQANQIPYHINGGTSFFSRAEIKDLMGYLRLIVNPEDDNAFLRVVNTPRREIGPSTLEKLGTYAGSRDISLYAASFEMGLEQHMEERYLQKLRRFSEWIDRVTQLCATGDPMAAIREMVDDSGYEAWLYQTHNSAQKAENCMANIHLLLDQLQASYERGEEDETIQDAISRLLLRDMLDRQAEEDDEDRVQLLTLHASKGLEYPHVFLMGMEEELLPHRTSIEEDNVEEERRLAYVGITRARQTLTMSLAAQRKQYGEWLDTQPSRFLDELPAEDLSRENFGDPEPEQRRTTGNSALAAMRAMLD